MKQRILTTVAILTVLLLGCIAVTAYAVSSIQSYTALIGDEQRKLDTQYAMLRSMRAAAAGLADTRQGLAVLSAAAIREGGELSFIRALEQAAAGSGVEQDIHLVTVNQKDTSAWERDIPLTLRIEGAYPDVLRHLNAVERLPYAITVQNISIEIQGSGGEPRGLVRATVSATAYWQGASAPEYARGALTPSP